MTALLLRLFVRREAGPEDPLYRAAVGRLSGIVGIVCNLLLFAGKLLIGILAGSVSITADAMNNLSDASSAIVTLVGFHLAEKPADADHPYGHARFEYLAGLAVSAMIVVIGFELARSSVVKIFVPAPVAYSPTLLFVLVSSIALKLWMAVFNRKLGRQINSTTLLAAATDSRNDAIATAAVLLEVLLETATSWQVDGYMGLVVALFILYSGVSLARDTISPLLGQAASPELRQLIENEVNACPKVLGYHDLMVHDYGPGQRFASIHVEMDRREDPLACHELIDEIERRCFHEHHIHLVIHYDPVDTVNPEQERLHALALELLQARDPRLTLHDFRMVQKPGEKALSFDVSLPDGMQGQENAILRQLERDLQARDGDIRLAGVDFDLAEP